MNDSVRTFRGKNVAEAMHKVRAELGSDAIVIEKREIRGKKSLFKLGGEEMVEIIATNSTEVVGQVYARKSRAPKGRTLLEKTYDTSSAAGLKCAIAGEQSEVEVELSSQRAPLPQKTQAKAKDHFGSGVESSSDFSAMMATMRSEILRMTSIQARGGFPAVGERLLDAYQMLLENEVSATIARSLVEELQQELGQGALDQSTVSSALCNAVAAMIRTVSVDVPARKDTGPAVISVVGPSGAGKTTTVVKMAFDFVYNQKKKVGLINEDFRRPGAAAQLQGLLSILDLPLVTADSPVSLANELRNMSDLDIVIIDTAGRGPRDRKGLADLSEILSAARSDVVHLAINAASTERSAMSCIQAFSDCGFDQIILSKLDEAPAYGLALNLARSVAQELSYVTTGQKWSGGLQQADAELLARLICCIDAPLE